MSDLPSSERVGQGVPYDCIRNAMFPALSCLVNADRRLDIILESTFGSNFGTMGLRRATGKVHFEKVKDHQVKYLKFSAS